MNFYFPRFSAHDVMSSAQIAHAGNATTKNNSFATTNVANQLQSVNLKKVGISVRTAIQDVVCQLDRYAKYVTSNMCIIWSCKYFPEM